MQETDNAPLRKNLWKPKDAAEFLGISVLTVGDWARAGKIPAKKIGRRWRFVPEHLQKWADDGTWPDEPPATKS